MKKDKNKTDSVNNKNVDEKSDVFETMTAEEMQAVIRELRVKQIELGRQNNEMLELKKDSDKKSIKIDKSTGTNNENLNHIVVFTLDEPRYALPLSTVERVVRAMEFTTLPNSPEVILGVINAQGVVIPVINIRPLLKLPAREIDCDDRFIIVRTSKRLVALLVDDVVGTREIVDGMFVSAKKSLPFAENLLGVAKLDNEMVLIYDLENLLTLDEEENLSVAMKEKSK